ncbi:MAG TPA: response regulator, partial [Flavisolibacter sp.]|nr:response regulator [Flavisolibacter sp.]
MNVQNTKILYIDDDADDRQFLAEAIKMVNPTVEVVCAENGIKGLDYLNTVKKTDAELPSLIVLDINMPYLDGKETFHTIRKDPELGTIPIVVFNSS